MATSSTNGIYGYETQLFAPAYGEAPSFYKDETVVLPASEPEIRVPMYDTEAIANGLPMYLGGTVSRKCTTLAETLTAQVDL